MSSGRGTSYAGSESLPKWFVSLGMMISLLLPYVVAYAIVNNQTSLLVADIGGLAIALLSIPFVSLIIIIIAYLWYNDEYWVSDVAKTSPNALAFLFVIAYPIAFSLTANTDMAVYFVGAYLIVIFVASYLYGWSPRVPTETGHKMGLFWAGVTAVVVLLISSLDTLINNGVGAWINDLMSPSWYRHVVMYAYTPLFIGKIASQFGINNELQLIPLIGLMAFVVGFSEEGWARLSIPLVAKYLNDNVTLSVWWLGTTWLSLHAIPIALEAGLSAVPINLLILSVISIFIFYVFAKTGDYVATAIAHGFYDLMVSLGFIGLILGMAFIVLFWRYHSVS